MTDWKTFHEEQQDERAWPEYEAACDVDYPDMTPDEAAGV